MTTASSLNGITLAAGSLQWSCARSRQDAPRSPPRHALEIVPLPPRFPLPPPIIAAPGEISAGIAFLVQWSPIPGATSYELQLASNGDFAGGQLITTPGTSHEVIAPTSGAVFARVRAIDTRCTPVPAVSAYSPVTAIFVLEHLGTIGTVPLADPGTVQYTIVLGPEFAGQTFGC